MTQELWTSVDNHITKLFIPVDPETQEAIADREATGLPSINVAPSLTWTQP
jgi:hypothetical protein